MEEMATSRKIACALWEHLEVWPLVHANPLCRLNAWWFLGSSEHIVERSSIVAMETPQWDAYSETLYKWKVSWASLGTLCGPLSVLLIFILEPQDLCIQPWPLPTALELCLTYRGISPLDVYSQTRHLHPLTCEQKHMPRQHGELYSLLRINRFTSLFQPCAQCPDGKHTNVVAWLFIFLCFLFSLQSHSVSR